MEERKVHRVGSGSLAITLPSKWVQRVGLEPGDSVALLEEDDASLLMVRSDRRREGRKAVSFEVSAEAPPGELERLLIGCYVVGHDVVSIQGKQPFTAAQLEGLRAAVSRLTGFGVIENRPERFRARSYLDASWCNREENLQRLLGLTVEMVAEAPAMIGRRDSAAAKEVLALGDQADRLYYLTVRFLLSALSDRALAARMGMESPQEITGCRMIAKALEEVGDSLETLAVAILNTESQDWGLEIDITRPVAEFADKICGYLTRGVDAFFGGSRERAEEILRGTYEMEHEKDYFVQQVLRMAKTPLAVAVLTVAAMALRDVCRFSRVIGEIAMNNAIRKSGVDGAASLGQTSLPVPATVQGSTIVK
ncbi:MAG TPA: phosphate uptake regulator PhoU [Thermoplasmata archaeon]|nr:phosphate uptake regulator PhoU [Thermoplasmata archaeon]